MAGTVENTERYDPAAYAGSGLSSKYSGGGDELDSDSCGEWERSGHVSFVGFFTQHGIKNIPYHSIQSIDQLDAKPCTRFEVKFHAVLEMPDDQGEIKDMEGNFKIGVEGKRMDNILRHIRINRRVTIHKSGKVDDAVKPQVDNVKLEICEPEQV